MTSALLADHAWLIPAAPLACSLLILVTGKSRRGFAAGVAITGQIIAFALALFAFLPTLRAPGSSSVHNFTWFTFGHQTLRVGWIIDPLTAAMLLMITFVALWIFVFSAGYMADDKNFARFFAYLSFFTAAMLGVVIANSLLLLFICWELVGLASYLLIGFWIERPSAAAAAKKAFITTRIGDIGFFLGLLWLYQRTGTLLFYDDGGGAIESHGLLLIGGFSTAISLLIFCGAIGKSGQFPLHTWLPDAMEGPTPVSALIHAATMVAAGVFLVARVYPIFSFGNINGVTTSLTVVVWIGVITALLSSLIAVAQYDIKRVLAYSTISQLGLMMVSLGVGGVAAGIMHLIAHGFFKALLFLGAGSVIHGLHHEQDIRRMGGLSGFMPVTFVTYAIGMMALSGVPLFFSGAWTKEEILHATAHWPHSQVPHYLMMAGVVLTALYMTRQMLFVFFGQPRASAAQAHESTRIMLIPLIVLVACTVLLSLAVTPAWPWLHSYLSAEAVDLHLPLLIQPLLLISLALVAAGVALGFFCYRHAGGHDPLENAQPALFRFLHEGMRIDRFYDRTAIALSRGAAEWSAWMDRYLWDGIIRTLAKLSQLTGLLTKGLDERGINQTVDQSTSGARALGRLLGRQHSGQIQTYLGAIALGMFLLLLFYAWL